jgi:RNA 2',3'-cyclic 3'-phosphodiesterase
MSYRLFIAVELPEHVKDVLVATQDALRAEQPPVRWTARAAMHLTLCFLGECDEALVEPIAGVMHGVFNGRHAPQVKLASAGSFPGVVWVGVAGDVAGLRAMQADLAAALEPLGFAVEQRRFTPHLTLGRVRRDADRGEVRVLMEHMRQLPPPEPVPWRAEHVALFRSELQPGGSRYTRLAGVVLTTQG